LTSERISGSETWYDEKHRLQEDSLTNEKGEQKKSDKWYDKTAKVLKNSMKRKKHNSILVDIKECNDSVHRLIGDVLEMTPIRMNRRTRLDTKKWESLRSLAESLHDTLEEGLSCDCGHCHMAHLRLESRSDKDGLEVRFGVLFSMDVFPDIRQETEIRILKPESARYLFALSLS
jgi:hypothetical protein